MTQFIGPDKTMKKITKPMCADQGVDAVKNGEKTNVFTMYENVVRCKDLVT